MIRERAVQFGPDRSLSGVIVEPRGRDADPGERPGFLVLNAGILHHVGPSRLHVPLTRALARRGFTALRFDFSGIGDSPPRSDGLGFDEACVMEVQAAADFLSQRRGITTVVVGGICSGADASFNAALSEPRVVGMIQVDGYTYKNWKYYVRLYAPRLIRLSSWRNFTMRLGSRLGLTPPPKKSRWTTEVRTFPPREAVVESLQSLVNRGVEQLHIYTGGQEQYQNYATQFWDNFRSVDFQGRAELHYLEQADHTFTSLDQQKLLERLILDWAARHWVDGSRKPG